MTITHDPSRTDGAAKPEPVVEEKLVVCSSCDAFCPAVAKVVDGQVTKVSASQNPIFNRSICLKGVYAPKSFAHPDRVLHPLRRVGERGSGQWEQVSWDEAMDDIARRLGDVVERYGPEALAVATSQWNTSVENGSGRRFMNLLGTPNWISGVALCAGNTAAVNRIVYGWFPWADYANTNCIVLFGHNPKRHSWTPHYRNIVAAQKRGAKLIVLDPRRSESAERADLWLPLRAGTDAAMCLGWLNVTIAEGLYDRDFVARWTVGFDDLAQRVAEYPLERVSEITGVEPDLIAEAARLYATTHPAVIPWTPITDQQVSSTSAIRLHCTLRAITGNLDVPGGDVFHPFHDDIVIETDLEMHEALPRSQKMKQLGCDAHPVFTYRGMEPLEEATQQVWGRRYANLVTGCYMAVPSAVFRAMAHGEPYPVKAFFSLANNTVMGFANMQLIYRGLMNQDLVVVHEHMMTPTAQLADYVLPGDSWLERPALQDGFGWVKIVAPSDQAMTPPGECRSVFAFWVDLARRMGLGEHFPWATLEDMLDHRLAPTGHTWESFRDTYQVRIPQMRYRKYEKRGFATPSGKVELRSSVLEGFGFDPLPYWRAAPQPDDEYPLAIFTGYREDEYFQTGQRHVPELRRRRPEPLLFVHPDDAAAAGVAHGDWAMVETRHGRCAGLVDTQAPIPPGLVRIPHGWWKPETPAGRDTLSSAWMLSDALLVGDTADFVDREQGIPHLKGIPCRVRPLDAAASFGVQEAREPAAGMQEAPQQPAPVSV